MAARRVERPWPADGSEVASAVRAHRVPAMCEARVTGTFPDPRGGDPIDVVAGRTWVAPELAMEFVRAGLDLFELPQARSIKERSRERRSRVVLPGRRTVDPRTLP